MQTQENLKILSTMKIYFGHQSVGYNMMGGVQDLLADNPEYNLIIAKTKDHRQFNKAIFAHSPNGRNLDPISKIDDFASTMNNGIGGKADVAFFKFCYVDFNSNTNIKEIFDKYRNEMAGLKSKYPETLLIHVTVPLTSEHGLKGFIKKILGKDFNPERTKFNNFIKEAYAPSLIFDLADIESTFPDGGKNFSTKGSEKIFYLVPEYTDDGGHLNSIGRKIIAEKFISFLSTHAKR
ncbi:MAG TPA: hypothetical protein PK859_03300 [Spirochaetota bacterium]|nr:hypothetical protein [Spirochaetota bacterium]HPR47773.1 hypothetical protein [Spirochaetota bacterium]